MHRKFDSAGIVPELKTAVKILCGIDRSVHQDLPYALAQADLSGDLADCFLVAPGQFNPVQFLFREQTVLVTLHQPRNGATRRNCVRSVLIA